MLRPNNIAAADYLTAVKPEVGYESKLYLSAQQSVEPGTFEILGANSGVFTPSASDAGALADAPAELLAVVTAETADAGANIVLTITGTDAENHEETWTATIQV